MRASFDRVAILDCIGFDLQDVSRPMQVRFAKCLVHDDGRIERQWVNDKLVCHRVTIYRGEDIDARMVLENVNIEAQGYTPPTPRMIERIKAHCAIEWDGELADEMLMLPAPEPMVFVPFEMQERSTVG